MKTKLKGVMFSLLGLVALLILILKLDLDVLIFYSIKHVPYLLIAALLILILPLILAFRMRYLLLAIGESLVSIKSLIAVEYMNKFFFNTAPAKMHLPVKTLLLNKICNVKMRHGVSIVTFEYTLDVSATLFFALLGVTFFFKNLPQVSITKLAFVVALFIASIGIFFNIPHNIFEKFTVYAENLHIPLIKIPLLYLSKILKVIRETWVHLIFNKKMYYVYPISLISWCILVLGIEFLFLSVNLFVPPLWILVVTSCAIFVGGITTIPGGLGVRDATMIILYGSLGVAYKKAIVVVVLTRILLWMPSFIGYILTAHMGLKNIKDYRFET